MRIERLVLERYGAFTGHAVEFGPAVPGKPDLHVVFGPNEAGKSTLFSAWMALLFGIPEKSPYAFLHERGALEVRATLDLDGARHDFARVTAGRGHRLIGPDGEAADEDALAAALGALGRDDFATMFSLDAEELEEGGRAILASDGRLGELLFSAGSGLSGVGAVLAEARESARAFFVPGGSARRLNELKAELAALDARIGEVDLRADDHRALVEERDRARAAHERAVREHARVTGARERVARLMRALDADDERRDLDARLSAMGPLPEAPPEWREAVAKLAEDEAASNERAGALADRRAKLVAALEAAKPDPGALAQAETVARLREAREGASDPESRMRTAADDLPRRLALLEERDEAVADAARAIGLHPDEPEGGTLTLDVAASLRALCAEHGGLLAAGEATARELSRADDALEKAREALDRVGSQDDRGEPAALDAAEARLKRLRRDAPLAELDATERRLAIARAGMVRSLPDGMDVESALAAIDACPALSPSRMAGWRSELDAILASERDIAARSAALDAEEARCRALGSGAGVASDEEAATSRAHRDAAWLVHREAVDAGKGATRTADAFAEALARDDALVERRLGAAAEVEALRAATRRLAEIEAERAGMRALPLIEEREALRLLMRDAVEPHAAIARPLPDWLVEGSASRIDLAALEEWIADVAERRSRLEALRELQVEREAAVERLGRAEAEVATLLVELDEAVPDGLDAMLDAAETRLRAERSRAETAHRLGEASERARVERDRRADEAETAERALAAWRERWERAVDGTFLAERPVASLAGPLDVKAVQALVDGAVALGQALGERRETAHRIATMRADVASFLKALEAVAGALDLPAPDEANWYEILGEARFRVERARELKRDEDRLERELRALGEEEDAHRAASRARAERLAAMADVLGSDEPQAMREQLERIAERDALRRERDGIVRRLRADLRAIDVSGLADDEDDYPGDGGDPEVVLRSLDRDALGEEGAALDASLPGLEAERDEASAAYGAARVASERQTLLMEIERGAHEMLALELGVEAASRALHRYRETHRSAMMERASRAFAAMSRGAFSGLVTLPDLDDERLAARRPDGGTVELRPPGKGRKAGDGGLSKGTRHQLYLALRIAGYQELAARRTPPPFMCDDVLETFDDERTAATLREFGDMARSGQVIVLTHHAHVLDIARTAVPGVRCHHLDGGAEVGLRVAAE